MMHPSEFHLSMPISVEAGKRSKIFWFLLLQVGDEANIFSHEPFDTWFPIFCNICFIVLDRFEHCVVRFMAAIFNGSNQFTGRKLRMNKTLLMVNCRLGNIFSPLPTTGNENSLLRHHHYGKLKFSRNLMWLPLASIIYISTGCSRYVSSLINKSY